MNPPADPTALWRPEDVTRWLALGAVGIGAWITGTWLASGDASLSDQIGPADVAVLGLVVFGAANVGWLMRGRRAVGTRMRTQMARLNVGDVVSLADLDVESSSEFVAVAGLVHFHRPDCHMVRGRTVEQASQSWFVETGRRSCGVCCRELDQ